MNDGPHLRYRTILLPSDGHRGIDRYSVALISGAASFSELLSEFQYIAKGRDGLTFITLDGLDQCLYTSGHATNRYGFGDGLHYPVDDVAEAREGYEAAVFARAQMRLNDPESRVAWDELSCTLLTSKEDLDALVEINLNPDVLLDEVHVVQNVPVNADTSLLAGIPNGYFEGDWTPFQNLAVSQRLVTRHGYAPLGIGASTLGFVRSIDQSHRGNIPALIADLQHLYGHSESSAWQKLAEILSNSSTLILGYTEDFAEMIRGG